MAPVSSAPKLRRDDAATVSTGCVEKPYIKTTHRNDSAMSVVKDFISAKYESKWDMPYGNKDSVTQNDANLLPVYYCPIVDTRLFDWTYPRSQTNNDKATMAILPYLTNYPLYARLVPRITSSLSLLGSFFIAYDVVNRKALEKVHHRILFGMSLADMISSFCTFLGRVPATRGDDVFPGYGNPALCTAQGFFYQSILSVVAYNFSLALYYLLLVRYNLSEPTLKKLEIIMHAFSVLVFVGSAVTLSSIRMFNPDYFLCFINSSPPGCVSDCDRGHSPSLFRWLFFYGPAWTMIFLISAMMLLLYWTVRNQEGRMDRFRFNGQATNHSNPPPDHSNTSENQHTKVRQTTGTTDNRERSRRVAVQGLWYTLPFYLTWIFPLTAHALGPDWIGQKGTPLLILVAIFLPLQGFMNAIVYARPMLQSRLDRYISTTRTTA